MARYKFMTLSSPQAANQIERDYKNPLTIAATWIKSRAAISKRIGIYGTSGSVSASTLP
jgi:hypothetical protein